jgi:hypothetical protein
MFPDVIAVVPQPGHRLELTFANGERRQFDMTPYLDPVRGKPRRSGRGRIARGAYSGPGPVPS